MKLLVTGAAGFIGANFIHYWTEKHPKDKLTVVDAVGTVTIINVPIASFGF